MKKLVLILMGALVLASSAVAAPKSTDKNVQALVIKIAKEALANKLAPVMYPKVTGVPIELLGTKVTYKDLKAKAAKDADAQKVVDAVNAKIAKMKIFLSDIKTDKVNEKANKSEFSADLTVGKRILMVLYTAQVIKGGKLQVKVAGLEHIYDKSMTLDLKNLKVLPLTKELIKKVDMFKNFIAKFKHKYRDEFETQKEFVARINKEKIKYYKLFFKNSLGSKDIFEIVCRPRRPPSISFRMRPTSIHCPELIDVIMMVRETQIDNLFANVMCIKNAAEVDFAGIVKTKKDQTKGFQAFICTIAEAKQIKKNLGNRWYCNVKLWVQFNRKSIGWEIVKVFIVPVKKK